jgi:hypothetical protein
MPNKKKNRKKKKNKRKRLYSSEKIESKEDKKIEPIEEKAIQEEEEKIEEIDIKMGNIKEENEEIDIKIANIKEEEEQIFSKKDKEDKNINFNDEMEQNHILYNFLLSKKIPIKIKFDFQKINEINTISSPLTEIIKMSSKEKELKKFIKFVVVSDNSIYTKNNNQIENIKLKNFVACNQISNDEVLKCPKNVQDILKQNLLLSIKIKNNIIPINIISLRRIFNLINCQNINYCSFLNLVSKGHYNEFKKHNDVYMNNKIDSSEIIMINKKK